MERGILSTVVVLLALGLSTKGTAQPSWTVGGNMGISIYDGSAGFHIGPMGEVAFSKSFSVGSEFDINTQSGTPIAWNAYGKYYFAIPGSKVQPYADFGMALYFYTGGPYFGLQFGGGANIPIASKLYISPEVQLGPVFGTGGGGYYDYYGVYYGGSSSTVFAVLIRAGIRYAI
jgi:hypothetical protein